MKIAPSNPVVPLYIVQHYSPDYFEAQLNECQNILNNKSSSQFEKLRAKRRVGFFSAEIRYLISKGRNDLVPQLEHSVFTK
ncbi:hypothetical protein COB11_08565 [Candidatus Aerophobetes bacterium]|uniref:Uncharacterized protein n=1 Tax=Aerophobetes bacterium TaxID=2030807 RepID=A0A2A4Y8U9_UNCAE|nr:MAG: hypothetical protein COB11_08565 [Candidatus Aerophobetes bacterium]